MTDIERRLSEYPRIKQRIRELELQIEELKAKRDSIYDDMLRGVAPEKDRVTGGPLYDPVVQAVTRLVDVYAERIRKVSADLAAAYGKLAQLEDMVNGSGLSETEQRYVRLRYFDGMAAWKVAQKIGYSERGARNIKDAILEKIQKRAA